MSDTDDVQGHRVQPNAQDDDVQGHRVQPNAIPADPGTD